MAETIAITQQAGNGGVILSGGAEYSAGKLEKLDELIADSETDLEVALTLDVSEVKAIVNLSDQDLLMEANDGDGGGGSLSLLAGLPYIWTTDSYDTLKLETDITALFMTNASGSAARFRLWVVVDPTP